ncbi:hypothetical protein C900_03281 [Fulvivirga imtechensis AK7]|uniref:TonB-dependent receptor n=1 Tax=Fulvivirga imtechensis AK7 TaxID=1237149 RepID=L8JPG7_9BACT|nr:hypothetical protein [Fulvivirga imtechensis]ELR70846.1 hypothetical protein C900_03281 [Fulvivirga imtechensis AK7]
MIRRLSIAFFLILSFTLSWAQEENQICVWVDVFDRPLILDSLSIIPGSVIIHHQDSAHFKIDHELSTGQITISAPNATDSIQVCFKVFPVSFHQQYYHRSLQVYDSNAFFKDPVQEDDMLFQREELFAIEGLNKSGSISRGVSFGNNQDVFVNSTLNLNMEGKLTDDLNIRAAITDQNVPFQPEGNTQQLQDFDNVFIQVYNEKFSVTGGDVVLKSRPSYFMKYYKNVQGGLAELNYHLFDSTKATTSLGISVAKGRFASVQIPPIEGVLGPYRIPGPNNEAFVIILANSERVFLDGKQLTRGFNNDYVIDYNSAEITFTSNVLITQFSRIRIDYEYSDQNYSRTITAASHYQESKKLSLFVSAYSEKDNRNRPLLLDLENEDKVLLSQIGDNLDLAVTSGVDSIGFSSDLILYKKTTATDEVGMSYTIYQYSTHPDSAVYRVTFSSVGLGNGNYVQAQTTANGRVYEWVPPVNGVPQGEYEPVIGIRAPNKKQLITMGGSYKVSPYESTYTELAFSDHDINLFSELDDGDDKGYAVKGGFTSEGRPVSFLNGYKWRIFASYELDGKYFNPIDRFRYIEFDRDWNYDPAIDLRRENDQIINAGIGFGKDQDNRWLYEVTHRRRDNQVNGFQHKANVDKTLGKFQLRTSLFYLDNMLDSLEATWVRYATDISYNSKFFVPGYIYHIDKNRIATDIADSVVRSSMYFDEHVFYLKNGKGIKLNYELKHSIREDRIPVSGDMEPYTYANTTQFFLNKDAGKHKLGIVLTYRKLDYQMLEETDESIAGRLDWQSYWLNRHLRSDLTYAISNGRELRREFVYIKVPPGEGTHTWRDLNDDNVQDLNEFFEAVNPDERNYAKIFVPTNQYVTAFQNLLIYRIAIEAPRTWSREEGVKKVLSRFSNNTSWTADVKTTDDAIETRLLGFARNVEDTYLLAERNILRSTLFYNRASPRYGIELSYSDAKNRQLLTNGFEFVGTEEYLLSVRVNLGRLYSFNIKTSTSLREVNSDFLEGRNYLIDSYRINPEIAWQPKGNIRVSGQYGYEAKENIYSSESGESAFFNEFILDLKLNKAVKSTFNARIRWVEIDFTGEENTPIGYDLLNALRPGRNITWGVNWQQRVASGLQLSLSYDGRKSESADVVHVGRVQVSALF